MRAFGFDPNVAEVERLNASETSKGVEYIPCFVGIHPDSSDAERMRTQQFWALNPWPRLSVARTIELRAQNAAPADDAEKMEMNLWQQTRLADIKKPVILPDFVQERAIDDIDFIKIDVDGPDYLILRSILPVLESKRVLGVGIEVNYFGSDHPDVNTFHNVDQTLRAAGFELFDLSMRRYSLAALPAPYLFSFPAQSKFGRPLQGDALYLRDLGSAEQATAFGDVGPAKIARLAALFSLFGQPDGAAELLQLNRQQLQGLFDVDAGLKALVQQSQPGFRGSYADYIAAFERDDPKFYRASEA